MNITSGIIPCAKKIVLYGPEGIGKSTFASKMPDPVFIDTEGSTKNMDVKRLDTPEQWMDIFEAVKYIQQNPECCKTLIVDTADWAEMLCIKYTCEKGGVNGIEDFGYGKGYTYVQENFKKLLDSLNGIIKLGINVMVTAHAKMRKFEQPDEMGAYDRWEMKLSRQVAPMLKEWADMVLFANYKTYVIEDDKTKSKKAQGGKRVMYTTHNPCWDAKNRYGLADCVDFSYDAIKPIIESTDEKPKKATKKAETKTEQKKEPEKPAEESYDPDDPHTVNTEVVNKLRELMKKDKISAKRLQYAVGSKGAYFTGTPFETYDPDFIQKSLIDKWAGFVKYARKFTDDEINMLDNPFNINDEKEEKK